MSRAAETNAQAVSLAGAGARARDRDALSPIWLVVRSVLIETVRRRDVYVLLMLMAIFAAGALVIRFVGTETATVSRFALNLGLTLALWAAKLLTALTAARQFPNEIESRTIYPLLAKPIGRGELVVGKFAAAWVAGLIATAALVPLAWLPVPKFETYSHATFVQMLALHTVALAMISALGVCLSLFLPKAVNLVLLLLAIFTGGALAAFVRARGTGHSTEAAWNWIAGYVPDLTRLELVRDYTDRLPPLDAVAFFARAGYSLAFTLVLLLAAIALFRRRSLA